jgi:hypothetical protein
MSKKQAAETTPETTTETKVAEKKEVHFSLTPDVETMFRIFDQPKQVRDICKLIILAGELSQKDLIQAMDDGGIKTRQNTERILYYYLKNLTETVGVKVESK